MRLRRGDAEEEEEKEGTFFKQCQKCKRATRRTRWADGSRRAFTTPRCHGRARHREQTTTMLRGRREILIVCISGAMGGPAMSRKRGP